MHKNVKQKSKYAHRSLAVIFPANPNINAKCYCELYRLVRFSVLYLEWNSIKHIFRSPYVRMTNCKSNFISQFAYFHAQLFTHILMGYAYMYFWSTNFRYVNM